MSRRGLSALFLAGFGTLVVAAEDGFVPLLNGTDLTGWEGPGWSVHEGILIGTAGSEAARCRWLDGEVDDFSLTVEVQVAGGTATLAFRATPTLERQAVRIPAGNAWKTIALTAAGHAIQVKIDGIAVPVPAAIASEPGKHLQGFLGFTAAPGATVKVRNLALKRLPLAEHRKKIVLLAGHNSHPLGEHEFEAGISAFRHALDKTPGVIAADYYQGWPTDPTAFANADAIVLYADGGGENPAIQGERLALLKTLTAKGVGLGLCHYAVEVPATHGGEEMLAMIGGYYENQVSANPIWTIAPKALAKHPVTTGVKVFSTKDEWYFNLHFRPDMQGITSILQDAPSDDVRSHPYSGSGPFDHVIARKGRSETLMWTVDNAGANRGFGYTGGHYHSNWANVDVRKLVLNAALWIAHADIPVNGVDAPLTDDELNGRLRERAK